MDDFLIAFVAALVAMAVIDGLWLGLVARSNAASKQAVQTIKQDIQHVEGEAVKKAEEVAAAVAKEKVAEGQPPRIVNG